METQSLVRQSNAIGQARLRRDACAGRSWSPHSWYLELKRRGVLEAGTNYVVVAWLIAQVAELIGDIFDAPDWILQMLLIALAVGLPIALILSWAFELTPGGLKREEEIASVGAAERHKGRGLVCALIAVLVLTIGALAVGRDVSACSAPPQPIAQQDEVLRNF